MQQEDQKQEPEDSDDVDGDELAALSAAAMQSAPPKPFVPKLPPKVSIGAIVSLVCGMLSVVALIARFSPFLVAELLGGLALLPMTVIGAISGALVVTTRGATRHSRGLAAAGLIVSLATAIIVIALMMAIRGARWLPGMVGP